MRIYLTTAERSYDYGWTKQLSPFTGVAGSRPVRLVVIPPQNAEGQCARYRSGMHGVWTVGEFEELCQTLPRTYAEYQPVTQDTDLLDLNLQSMIVDAENSPEKTIEFEAGYACVLLIALGIFEKRSGTTMALVKGIHDVHADLTSGALWDRLWKGDRS